MRDLYERLVPRGRIMDLRQDGWTIWDCSPITGPDGRVHLFATRWRSLDRPDSTWFLGSQIIHAVADVATGPYEIKDIVVETDGSSGRWDSSGVINPKVYQLDGRYCLFYTGCTSQRHDTQAIGLMLADSLEGPWERASEEPLIASSPDRTGFDGYLCNNPAFVKHPNGQFWVYYKGRPVIGEESGHYKAGDMTIGLAVADCLCGPYRKHATNPVVKLARQVEDPYVWHDGTDFWMLVSELGVREPAGLLLQSSDGLTWSDPIPAYPSPLTFCGRNQRLEEPNVLFADGKPTHLFNIMGACPDDDGYSGFVFEITGMDG